MILRYWKGPLCTVRTRPAMDAIVEELLQIFVFWKGFLHYVKSVSFYSIAHFTDLEAHKNEVTKKLVAVLLLWVTGEKVTVFLGDDKWRQGLQDVHKRDTICRLLTLVSRTDASSYCEGNEPLVCSRALFRRLAPAQQLQVSAGDGSRRCQQREQAAHRSGAASDTPPCCPGCRGLG